MIKEIIKYLARRLEVIDKEYGKVDHHNLAKHFAATMVTVSEVSDLEKYIQYLEIIKDSVPSIEGERHE